MPNLGSHPCPKSDLNPPGDYNKHYSLRSTIFGFYLNSNGKPLKYLRLETTFSDFVILNDYSWVRNSACFWERKPFGWGWEWDWGFLPCTFSQAHSDMVGPGRCMYGLSTRSSQPSPTPWRMDTLASHQNCALPTSSYHLPTPWVLGVCRWDLC